MAEKDPDGPSLELPSFGFGRRRNRGSEAERPPEPQPSHDPPHQPPSPHEPPPPHQPPPPEAPSPRARQQRSSEPATDVADAPPPSAAPDHDHDEPASRRGFSLPAMGAVPAALVTGLVVGLLTVGLVWASLRLCELVRGTSSCGTPGFFVLLGAILLAGAVGAALLRGFSVPSPGSASALGLGLVAVVALLFLGDHLFAWWMVIAIPMAAMAAYALAHWVTTALVDVRDDRMHR